MGFWYLSLGALRILRKWSRTATSITALLFSKKRAGNFQSLLVQSSFPLHQNASQRHLEVHGTATAKQHKKIGQNQLGVENYSQSHVTHNLSLEIFNSRSCWWRNISKFQAF